MDFAGELITGVATAFVAWLFARRKRKAEAGLSEMEVVEKAVSIWRGTAERLIKEVDELRAEVAKLRKENTTLLSEVDNLKRVIAGRQMKL